MSLYPMFRSLSSLNIANTVIDSAIPFGAELKKERIYLYTLLDDKSAHWLNITCGIIIGTRTQCDEAVSSGDTPERRQVIVFIACKQRLQQAYEEGNPCPLRCYPRFIVAGGAKNNRILIPVPQFIVSRAVENTRDVEAIC